MEAVREALVMLLFEFDYNILKISTIKEFTYINDILQSICWFSGWILIIKWYLLLVFHLLGFGHKLYSVVKNCTEKFLKMLPLSWNCDVTRLGI